MPTNFSSKSFILHGDGYKKYEGASADIISDISSIPVMVNNTSPFGVANANPSPSSAYLLFDNNDTSVWFVEAKVGWISYQFLSPIQINGYSLLSGNAISPARRPKSWTFEGLNKKDNVWVILDRQENEINWLIGEKRSYYFPNNNEYDEYKLNISENNGNNFLLLSGLEMHEVSVASTPPSWKTVSQTLPTLTQFQSEGMEDLSSLDRKVQPVLESPQQMTQSVLGEGKVFKGTVDLKKYFDLRKLEVK